MRRPWSGETLTTTTRPDGHPMATVDAITADRLGRYAGGSHNTLCDSQVTHTESSLSPTSRRLTCCEAVPSVDTATGAGVADSSVSVVWHGSDVLLGSSVPLPFLIFLNRYAAIKKRFAEIANDISDLFYGNFATV
jgi:hypothetical protein